MAHVFSFFRSHSSAHPLLLPCLPPFIAYFTFNFVSPMRTKIRLPLESYVVIIVIIFVIIVIISVVFFLIFIISIFQVFNLVFSTFVNTVPPPTVSSFPPIQLSVCAIDAFLEKRCCKKKNRRRIVEVECGCGIGDCGGDRRKGSNFISSYSNSKSNSSNNNNNDGDEHGKCDNN